MEWKWRVQEKMERLGGSSKVCFKVVEGMLATLRQVQMCPWLHLMGTKMSKWQSQQGGLCPGARGQKQNCWGGSHQILLRLLW